MPKTLLNSAMVNIYLNSVKVTTMIYNVWDEKKKKLPNRSEIREFKGIKFKLKKNRSKQNWIG